MSSGSPSVWYDIHSDDPCKAAQMEARSLLMMQINKRIKEEGWTGKEAAARLGITRPQASDLMNGKLSKFSMDALVRMLRPVGLRIDVQRKASA